MQTWSISYTSDLKKLKNRNWLQGNMNYNPNTNMAHFYDEDSVEIGKLKMQKDKVVADGEVSLWRYLIEIGQLESTEEECVEEVFDRLNRELGIEEFNHQKTKKQKIVTEPVKIVQPPQSSIKTRKNPSQVGINEPVILYDILYTQSKDSNQIWQDGILKYYPNLMLAEFYEGIEGKLVHKKVMTQVKEGEIIEEACGGSLKIEICSIRPNEIKSKSSDKIIYSILYTTDKHKKSKKWLDGLLEFDPSTKLAKFLDEENHACFYKKIISEGVSVGEEMITGIYILSKSTMR